MVLATGSELIDDIKRTLDDVLSNPVLINELIQPEYTLDLLNLIDTYFTNVVRYKLMRDTAGLFSDVREELVMAMNDLVQTREHKWINVPIQEAMQRVICRTTNRIFCWSSSMSVIISDSQLVWSML
ncbi:hypothetical protein F5888DRAFT_1204997 [Russula emetica]|nr:hypothetical protein F5888DRAFT_1204997 [Russula emetica]